jgi:SAM-dependent methyltransferase
MPLPDRSADAVLASSSWHWMDLVPTLHEVGRVLVPGGTLGALWSGPDPDGPFLVQAQALLAARSDNDAPADTQGATSPGDSAELSGAIINAGQTSMTLEVPPDVPFGQPEHKAFTWDIALNADELIGLLGTISWVILMPDDRRARVFAEARRLLRDMLGVEGDVTVDVAFRSDAWLARRDG